MQLNVSSPEIPARLRYHFQEYNPSLLDFERDVNLIIQRTLEFGTWDEIRWLFKVYRRERIRLYVREYGLRGLTPVTFNYWRKLLKIRKWKKSPFPTPVGEVWKY